MLRLRPAGDAQHERLEARHFPVRPERRVAKSKGKGECSLSLVSTSSNEAIVMASTAYLMAMGLTAEPQP